MVHGRRPADRRCEIRVEIGTLRSAFEVDLHVSPIQPLGSDSTITCMRREAHVCSQCAFMSETSRNAVPLTAVGTVWRDGCRFLTQVGDGGRYSCYPELPRCDADEASLRSLSDLPDGLFPDIIATRWLSVVGHVVQRAGWPGPPGRQFVAIGPLWRLAAAFGLA